MTYRAATRRMTPFDAALSGSVQAARKPGRVAFYDYHPQPADLRSEVLAGLSGSEKRLPPKLFYDRDGSRLFDAITELPEYYPTRTEIALLREHGAEMATRLGRDAILIELGSGSSLKIQILLTALRPRVYMPVDISREHLRAAAEALAAQFPGLVIRAACADYSAPFELPLEPDWHRLTAFFPGSSIGNFEPVEARGLLERVAGLLGPEGRLLIGVDLRKDQATLDAAYNDAQGITAAFNLNILRRINRELGGRFDLGAFAHRAFFNEAASRVEMHLVSLADQEVEVAGTLVPFRCGETIHTENSYKYSVSDFKRLAEEAGFATEQVWTDRKDYFSVHCLRALGTSQIANAGLDTEPPSA